MPTILAVLGFGALLASILTLMGKCPGGVAGILLSIGFLLIVLR